MIFEYVGVYFDDEDTVIIESSGGRIYLVLDN